MTIDDSLATTLLVGRLRGDTVKPLKSSEYWRLRNLIGTPSRLLGLDTAALVADHGIGAELAARIAVLLDRATGMAFELERLGQSGITTLTPFDEHYPQRFTDRLGVTSPALLYAVGAVKLFGQAGLGVQGSRAASSEGLAIAWKAAERAASLGLPLVSGGARGVDRAAMAAASAIDGAVIGFVADSLLRRLRRPDVRREIHAGNTVLCTPYSPDAPFTVGKAMGRNRLICAQSRLSLVVAADAGKGGSWSGAEEALRRGFGRVAVWRGPGEGPGNEQLEARGAIPVASLNELEAALLAPDDLDVAHLAPNDVQAAQPVPDIQSDLSPGFEPPAQAQTSLFEQT